MIDAVLISWSFGGGILFDSYLYSGCMCYYSVCRKQLLPVLLERVEEDRKKTYSYRKELFSGSCSLQKIEITTLEYFYSEGRCQF